MRMEEKTDVESIKTEFNELLNDVEKFEAGNNKAAGRRVRLKTVELEKFWREWRVNSTK